MKVVFARKAKTDLSAIGDHIARDSPRRAASFVAELEGKALSIGETPQAFPVVGHSREAEIRRRVHGDYLIFFLLGRDIVRILRVVHGARDYAKLLGLEPGEDRR